LRVKPRFGDWRQINAQALVAGSTQAQRDGRLKVEFRLWDVFGEVEMTGLAYFTAPDNWRRVAHIIADEIYKRITGESGYFDTRVSFISLSRVLANRRIKRLAIMDQDGANHRFLTDGRGIGSDTAFLAPGAGNNLSVLWHRAAAGLYLQYRYRPAGSPW
jgi:TolB protein